MSLFLISITRGPTESKKMTTPIIVILNNTRYSFEYQSEYRNMNINCNKQTYYTRDYNSSESRFYLIRDAHTRANFKHANYKAIVDEPWIYKQNKDAYIMLMAERIPNTEECDLYAYPLDMKQSDEIQVDVGQKVKMNVNDDIITVGHIIFKRRLNGMRWFPTIISCTREDYAQIEYLRSNIVYMNQKRLTRSFPSDLTKQKEPALKKQHEEKFKNAYANTTSSSYANQMPIFDENDNDFLDELAKDFLPKSSSQQQVGPFEGSGRYGGNDSDDDIWFDY